MSWESLLTLSVCGDVRRHNRNISHADICRPVYSQLWINDSIFMAGNHGATPTVLCSCFLASIGMYEEIWNIRHVVEEVCFINSGDGIIKRVGNWWQENGWNRRVPLICSSVLQAEPELVSVIWPTSDWFALKVITKGHVLVHQELQHTLTEQPVMKNRDPIVILW